MFPVTEDTGKSRGAVEHQPMRWPHAVGWAVLLLLICRQAPREASDCAPDSQKATPPQASDLFVLLGIPEIAQMNTGQRYSCNLLH